MTNSLSSDRGGAAAGAVRPVPRYSKLLLDFDGTLFDTRDAVKHALLATGASRRGGGFDEAIVDEVIWRGLTLLEMMRGLAPTADPAETARLIGEYRSIYNSPECLAKITPYDDLLNFLNDMKRHDVSMIIVSNKSETAVRACLRRYGVEAMFLEVIGATGAAPVKPDPRAVMHRIDPIFGQGRRDDALMVGDTGADMAFARAIGVASCWVSYGYGRPEDLRRLQPTLTAASLRDVAAHALETKAPT